MHAIPLRLAAAHVGIEPFGMPRRGPRRRPTAFGPSRIPDAEAFCGWVEQSFCEHRDTRVQEPSRRGLVLVPEPLERTQAGRMWDQWISDLRHIGLVGLCCVAVRDSDQRLSEALDRFSTLYMKLIARVEAEKVDNDGRAGM